MGIFRGILTALEYGFTGTLKGIKKGWEIGKQSVEEALFLDDKKKMLDKAIAIDKTMSEIKEHHFDEAPAYRKYRELTGGGGFLQEVTMAKDSRTLRDILSRMDLITADDTSSLHGAERWFVDFKDSFQIYFNEMFEVRQGWKDRVLAYAHLHDISYKEAKKVVQKNEYEQMFADAMESYRKFHETNPLIKGYESSSVINAVIAWVVEDGGDPDTFFQNIRDSQDTPEEANLYEKVVILSNKSSSFR